MQKKDIESLDTLSTSLDNGGTSPSASLSPAKSAPTTLSEGAMNYAEQKEQAKLRRKLEQTVRKAEERVEHLESEMADLEAEMATPEGAGNAQLFTRHGELRKQLEIAEEDWAAAVEALG